MNFVPTTEPQVVRDVKTVKYTLHLTPTNNEVIITYGAAQTKPDELAVLSRSMIQVMT